MALSASTLRDSRRRTGRRLLVLLGVTLAIAVACTAWARLSLGPAAIFGRLDGGPQFPSGPVWLTILPSPENPGTLVALRQEQDRDLMATPLCRALVWPQPRYAGLLAPSVREYFHTMYISNPGGPTLGADELKAVRAVVTAAVMQRADPIWLAHFTAGDGTTQAICWPGMAMEVSLWLFTLAAAASGFVWLGWRRSTARLLAFESGATSRCPMCRYDCQGLTTCAECGFVLPPRRG